MIYRPYYIPRPFVPYPVFPAAKSGFAYPYYAAAPVFYHQPSMRQEDPPAKGHYPPVHSDVLSQSASAFRHLMREASIVLDKLADSPEFAKQVMTAAQSGNQKEVDQLVKSTGIDANVKTSYTPDGVLFKLSADVQGSPCCDLTMYLRWG